MSPNQKLRKPIIQRYPFPYIKQIISQFRGNWVNKLLVVTLLFQDIHFPFYIFWSAPILPKNNNNNKGEKEPVIDLEGEERAYQFDFLETYLWTMRTNQKKRKRKKVNLVLDGKK